MQATSRDNDQPRGRVVCCSTRRGAGKVGSGCTCAAFASDMEGGLATDGDATTRPPRQDLSDLGFLAVTSTARAGPKGDKNRMVPAFGAPCSTVFRVARCRVDFTDVQPRDKRQSSPLSE